jgi:hypothetical protein
MAKSRKHNPNHKGMAKLSLVRAPRKATRAPGGLKPTSRSTRPFHTSHQGGRGSKSGGYFAKTVYR